MDHFSCGYPTYKYWNTTDFTWTNFIFPTSSYDVMLMKEVSRSLTFLNTQAIVTISSNFLFQWNDRIIETNLLRFIFPENFCLFTSLCLFVMDVSAYYSSKYVGKHLLVQWRCCVFAKHYFKFCFKTLWKKYLCWLICLFRNFMENIY